MSASASGPLRLGAPLVLTPLSRSERLVHERPVLGFVSLAEREVARAALARAAVAARSRVAFLRVLPRTRPGSELLERDGVVEGVAASSDQLASVLQDALKRLVPHDVLCLEGTTGMGRLRCDLSILIACGVPVSEWPADLRALRSELRLVLEEPREQTFAYLLRGLLAGAHAAHVTA